MSFFITETTEDLPRVLLIGNTNFLQRKVLQFLEEKKVQAHSLRPEEILNTKNNPNLNAAFYKIIWLLDFNKELDTAQNILSFLSKRREPLLILTNFVTGLVTEDPTLKAWAKRSGEQEQFLLHLKQNFPQVSVCIGRDVVGWAQNYEPPISYLADQFSSGRLLQPAVSLTLQTLDVFFEKIKKYVLQPKKGVREMVVGESVALSDMASYLQRLYHQQTSGVLQFLPAIGEERDWGEGFHAVKTHQKDNWKILNNALQEAAISPQKNSPKIVARLFSTSENTAPMPPRGRVEESVASPKLQGVVPGSLPVIENRLRKYEQKKEEVRLRQRVGRRSLSAAQIAKTSAKKNKTLIVDVKAQAQEKHLEEQIQNVFGNHRTSQKYRRVAKKVEKTLVIETKNHRRTILTMFITLVVGVLAIISGMWVTFSATKQHILSDISIYNQTLSTPSQPPDPALLKDLSIQSEFFANQVNFYQLFLGKERLADASLLAAIGSETAGISQTFVDINSLVKQTVVSFFGKQETDTFQALGQLNAKIEDLYKKLSLLQAQLKTENFNNLSEQQLGVLTSLSDQLQDKRRLFVVGEQIQQLLPNLLAQKSRKTYLVLLQNNQELRPTGGYLHAVALLTVEKGELIDYQVYDVNTIDNMFQGLIQPPPEIQAYLGQSRWYLHDANWSPNFPQSAQQASLFVEKTLGRKPDVVIALNLYVLQDLLHNLGSVELPEYNEVITDKNLFERAEFHSEIKLVQSPKADYLTTLFTRVLAKVVATPPEKATALLSSFYTSLRQGQLFITFSDASQNSLLSSLGWLGEVSTPQCPAQLSDVPCVVDTMMQVEANVGINKANYYLERSIDHEITLQPGKILHQRTVTFKNTAGSTAWPLGEYKNFLRFYVPNTAQIQSVSVDDQAIAPQNIITRSEGNKISYGILISVPIQHTVRVKIQYSEPLDQSGAFSYAFFNQKQSGTAADPLKITIQPDASFHPLLIAPQAQMTSSGIQFNTTQDRHVFVGVKFQ